MKQNSILTTLYITLYLLLTEGFYYWEFDAKLPTIKFPRLGEVSGLAKKQEALGYVKHLTLGTNKV